MDMIATELAAPANKLCHLLKNVVTSTSKIGAKSLLSIAANGTTIDSTADSICQSLNLSLSLTVESGARRRRPVRVYENLSLS